VVNLLDAEPVQDIGHESLEAHVFDTGDELRGLEILVRAVTSTLAEVVDEVPVLISYDIL
jgi:hypothetical protein